MHDVAYSCHKQAFCNKIIPQKLRHIQYLIKTKISFVQAMKLTYCFSQFLNVMCSDMEFLDVLTEGLERVLLVRGGGREVITIYS